jgi:hypothetical protein
MKLQVSQSRSGTIMVYAMDKEARDFILSWRGTTARRKALKSIKINLSPSGKRREVHGDCLRFSGCSEIAEGLQDFNRTDCSILYQDEDSIQLLVTGDLVSYSQSRKMLAA